MTRSFGARSSADDVLLGVDLSGRRVLITGVSAGLGVETARSLAAHGAQVVGTVRDTAKAGRATADIPAQANGGGLTLATLDLASLKSVRACSNTLLEDGRPFDAVIANAGVMWTPFGRTSDGFETQFGTNHLGHFVFVNRIASLIAPHGRLVMVASTGHRRSDVDLDDPGFEHQAYDPGIAYARSKTANILFAVEFDRRHRARGVRAAAVHPGVVKTELDRHMQPGEIDRVVEQINAPLAAAGQPLLQYKTVAQGAATSVWAGFVAGTEEIGGRYCQDCQVSPVIHSPVGPSSPGVMAYAVDPGRAMALWAKSEEMVGERF
ncbi:MAG: SDR family NAD(P)-dependent oxidoreductase [Nevskia sp.]|nr:SDR family NAD(P)-dependent oxidoreductase [Nevskia sp.]